MNDKKLLEYLIQNNYVISNVELNHPDMSFICMKSLGDPLDKYGMEFTLQTYDLTLLIDAKKIWKK